MEHAHQLITTCLRKHIIRKTGMGLHRNVTMVHQPPVFDDSGLPHCGSHSRSSFFQPSNKHFSWALFTELVGKLWIQADDVEAALSLEAYVLARDRP